jgi:RNA polymerase sigma-70 factor (ECF subfamily)
METLARPRLEVRCVTPLEAGELVRAARNGDSGAFGRIYENFAAMVHGILLTRVRPREVPDLVQDVFLSALRGLRGLEEPENVGAWLASIARNRALDWQRAAPAKADVGADFDPPDPRSGEPDEEREQARAALEAVRSLPEAYRETLVLRLCEGLSGPEIAQRCGLTHGSVRVNLHRGMKLLRERLARADGLPKGTP